MIVTLARECRLIAARIEREFGTTAVSRSQTHRDAMELMLQTVRLKREIDEWFDART